MVSFHSDTEAYTTLLETVRNKIIEYATLVVQGDVELSASLSPEDRELALWECEDVAKHGYSPRFIEIDGDDAERAAIEATFSAAVPIRMCQFHLMRAIRARSTRKFTLSTAGVKKSDRFLEAVRKCQRCRSEEDWAAHVEQLRNDLQEISGDTNTTTYLMEYMDRQWFSTRWRDSCTDIGLPEWATRDDVVSTNNTAEVSFRVLDRVFLNCQANKRWATNTLRS